MTKTSLDVSIVLERRRLSNAWVSEQWEATGVVPAADEGRGDAPRCLRSAPEGEQWLVPGARIELFTDEAENYLLNVGGAEPRVFVMWRMEEGDALPHVGAVTVSFGEAARMLDSGEKVDGAPMPPDIRQWVESFAQAFYRPEVRKKGGRFASVRDGGSRNARG